MLVYFVQPISRICRALGHRYSTTTTSLRVRSFLLLLKNTFGLKENQPKTDEAGSLCEFQQDKLSEKNDGFRKKIK